MITKAVVPLALAGMFSVLGCGSAQAMLLDRGNGLLYDDVLNVTWLQNANLAETQTFGVTGIRSDGSMYLPTAREWVAAMNQADYLGYDDWRLPTMLPVNGSSYRAYFSYDGTTDVGYNMGGTSSELAYMYYRNLGAKALYSPSGKIQWDFGPNGQGVDGYQRHEDVGLVENLVEYFYWSDSTFAPDPSNPDYTLGLDFSMYAGYQGYNGQRGAWLHAWAVRPGDVVTVPEPSSVGLVLAGLGLIGMQRTRRRSARAR